MDEPPSDYYRVWRLLRNLDLAHPDGQLLECFLDDSIDNDHAARYMFQKCSVGGEGLEVESFLSDWKQLINLFVYDGPINQLHDKAVIAKITERDGGRCRLTGLGNSFRDPLIVAPILPSREINIDENLHEMFGAFAGTDLLDWVLSKTPPSSPYRSHWLVRKSAAAALWRGYFEVEMVKGSQMSRFAKSIRWTLISREIANKRGQGVSNLPPASRWRFLSEWGSAAALMVWRLVPAFVRVRAYHGLAFLGAHMYGSSCSFKVQRLPFGMYLKSIRKECQETLANEYATLQLVRRHTGITVPRPVDLVSDSTGSYLVTTRVKGILLGQCIDTLSVDEETTLICDLHKSLAELRAIPKVVAPEHAITSALGRACYDHRINAASNVHSDNGYKGPFRDEDEFNDNLRNSHLPHISHGSGHQIVFTHGDLNMRNILMHNGRLSGIIDWEHSGWYPEYWDYTKACYVTKLNLRWLKMIGKVCQHFGDYTKELAIENQLWQYCFP
ncbi:hypothetical protein E4U41_005303 [Claviceps citrina]|nr:hypothetical protein E4U41_005303 [Claviceps citrina]